MTKHLLFNKRFLALLLTLFIGVSCMPTLFAQQPFAFSVSGSQQVYFSPGNLQYRASTNTWRFAINPWDCVGSVNSNISSTYTGWIDLFGWGTSDYNHGATCYQPWSTSTSYSDYYAYGNYWYNLFDQTGQADWGYNAISNGGNEENSGWRTLTKDEWNYLFYTRATSSGIRYAKAKVNNVTNGVILLPDDWSTDYYTLNSTNTDNASFSTNVITASQWATLEQHGAVFLPAAGNRNKTSVDNVGSNGYYWSASYYDDRSAYNVIFGDGYLGPCGYSREYGRSVRLVRAAENYSFIINATPSPAEGGAVSGAGTYMTGAECTLTAMPSAGYAFGCWTEEDVVVSMDATYTFIALRDRNLVANFVTPGNIEFADANVKAICVANWDVNGDGELSYAEAAKVTNLGEMFKNNTSIHSFNELQYFIFLPSIGEQAFYGCTELTQVTIPERVTTVGSKAFWNCPALQTVFYNAVSCNIMQSTYNSNTYSVFSSNSSGGASALTRVVIGSNVTRIPNYAFKGSVDIYQRLVIPASVQEIGSHTFDGCNSLVQMVIQGNGLLTIGDYAFCGCSALRSALNLPNSVTTVGQYAFYGCSVLPSVTFGTDLEIVGGCAFWNCPTLTTVNFNATNCTTMVTNSQYSVFNSGTSNGGTAPITTLSIGNNVTNIPDYAFRYSSNVTGNLLLPNGLKNIGQYAFDGCSDFIGDLVIPNAVTALGQYAFHGCSGFNGTLTLPINDSLTIVNQSTFAGCTGLTGTLTIPANVTEIAFSAFDDCSGFTGSLVLHNEITTIGEYAFYGCSNVSELTIGQGVIGECAFYGCSNISELTIGQGVTTIGGFAFWNCPSIAMVHFNATNCTSMVTNSQYSVFNSGTSNGGGTPIVTLSIGENVTNIPAYAFRYSNNLACDLIIPDAVTSIGNYAFANCSGHNVFTGNNVTSLPEYTFYSSAGFNGTLILGNALTSIGQYAFDGCSGFIGDLVIPNTVTTLGEYAFRGCSGFDGSLVIGSGVQTINQYTFANCSGFAGSLIVGRQVNSIGNRAFQNCGGFSVLISENPTPPAAVSNSFQSMNFTIPVYVPYAMIPDYQSANGWSQFTNYVEQCVFDQLDNDLWSDENNWYAFELPGPNDVVCVNSNCHLNMDAQVLHIYVLNLNDALTITSNQTLTTDYGIGILQASQLVMEEGSQLINNMPGLYGTMHLNLGGYGRDGDGWFTIAAPIYGGMPVNAVTLGNYDMYAYDEPTHYWRNQKVAENNITMMNPCQGYLYSNQSPTTLSLSGQLNPSNAQFNVPVTYQGSPLAGYTLLGNPYTNNLNISDVKLNGTPLTTYYKIHGGGSLVAYSIADPIHPGEGFLVMAPEGGTITFEPSVGQNRESDEPVNKGDLEPMRGFRLPAHAFLLDVNAFEGESQAVAITTMVNITEGGTVSGGGNYTVGSTCTLTATPNENYSFVNWTLNGTPVSSNATYTFSVMGAGTYMANFEQTTFTQATALTNGWNWWSSYIELNDIDGLALLENALGNHGQRIVSHGDGYVEPLVVSDAIYWYGTLTEITNEQMYKIKTNSACVAPVMGSMTAPSDHPITIHSGWNWIGYPSNQGSSLNSALAGFDAEEEDVIKSYNDGYATYYNGSWIGTLNNFEPGKGYMYHSNSGTSKTLVYQPGSKLQKSATESQPNFFKASSSNFMDNMTITAIIELDGQELRSDGYELAAFVGEECRGSIRLKYVEPIDRYVAFLTVYGDASESLSFMLADGNQLSRCNATIHFEVDGVMGTLTSPVPLRFGSWEVEETAHDEVAVLPNPFMNEIVIAGEGVRRIEVFNVVGQRVFSGDANGTTTRINLSTCSNGVYIVRLLTEKGVVTNYLIKE